MKRILTLIVVVFTIVALVACDSNDDYSDDNENIENTESEMISLTVAELKMYDGKDGSDAYVAVNGVIYDVTDEWSNGTHNGMNAGNDITDDISFAPHGVDVLDDLEVIGAIIE